MRRPGVRHQNVASNGVSTKVLQMSGVPSRRQCRATARCQAPGRRTDRAPPESRLVIMGGRERPLRRPGVRHQNVASNGVSTKVLQMSGVPSRRPRRATARCQAPGRRTDCSPPRVIHAIVLAVRFSRSEMSWVRTSLWTMPIAPLTTASNGRRRTESDLRAGVGIAREPGAIARPNAPHALSRDAWFDTIPAGPADRGRSASRIADTPAVRRLSGALTRHKTSGLKR